MHVFEFAGVNNVSLLQVAGGWCNGFGQKGSALVQWNLAILDNNGNYENVLINGFASPH